MSSVNYGPSLPQRLTPSISRLEQLLEAYGQTLRVAAIGVVQSFQPGPPATVTVQIATAEPVFFNQGSPDAISLGSSALPIEVLTDVPVQFLTAGGWSVTMPIQQGDECLLVFADASIDTWFQNGASDGPVNPGRTRRHDLSDAIAVFGLRSTPKGLDSYSPSSMQLRNDDASVVIDLATDQITVTAKNVTVNCSGTADIEAQTATVHSTGDATINAGGNVTVEASGSATVTAGTDATVHATNTVTAEGTTAVVNASGDATVQAGGTAHITGSNVNIGSNTTIDSRSFLNHVHHGVTTGSGVSGPVV